jgi:hypothetical protein
MKTNEFLDEYSRRVGVPLDGLMHKPASGRSQGYTNDARFVLWYLLGRAHTSGWIKDLFGNRWSENTINYARRKVAAMQGYDRIIDGLLAKAEDLLYQVPIDDIKIERDEENFDRN